jgi:hypothetical protein
MAKKSPITVYCQLCGTRVHADDIGDPLKEACEIHERNCKVLKQRARERKKNETM